MPSENNTKLDRRTLKTKRALKKAFIELLDQKPIDKITVAELAEKSDIGRGTFYIHYQDVYDLYDTIVSDTLSDLIQIFDTTYPPKGSDNFHDLSKQLVTYIVDRKQIFTALTTGGTDTDVLSQLNRLMAYKVLESEDITADDYLANTAAHFASHAMLGVVVEWLQEEDSSKKVTLHQLINLIAIDVSVLHKFNLKSKRINNLKTQLQRPTSEDTDLSEDEDWPEELK